MPTKNPRVHTVLEAPLYKAVSFLARRDGVSLSQKVRDLVREAIEYLEDAALDNFAEARRRSFQSGKAFTVGEIRRRLRLR